MTRRPASTLPPLSRWHAVILHPPHPTVEAITRQLERLGLTARAAWPTLEPEDLRADVVFFDVDTGHDAQFPWAAGEAPMPQVAIIGSEAAGRIAWAIGRRFEAQLLKPIGAAGVFSALLIAAEAFARGRQSDERIGLLKERLGKRAVVVRAVLTLMDEGCSEETALSRLRALAMNERTNLEEAAERVVAGGGALRRGRGRPSDKTDLGDIR